MRREKKRVEEDERMEAEGMSEEETERKRNGEKGEGEEWRLKEV